MAGAKRVQGDHLKDKSRNESQFETAFSSGAGPKVPLKLGFKEYDRDLWDTPLMRELSRAVVGWQIPPPGPPSLSRVLKDDDPRLTETVKLPGRDAWRAALQAHLVSSGTLHKKPTAWFIAGPFGAGKRMIADRLLAEGVLPAHAVRADAHFIQSLIPEHSELRALGEARAAGVVHEEASVISRAAFADALAQKRDLIHAAMFCGPAQHERLTRAKAAGFRRQVVAICSTLDVAKARAGTDGAVYPERLLLDSHRDFSKGFEELHKSCEELVLLMNLGNRIVVAAKSKAGELMVKERTLFDHIKNLANAP